MTVKVSVVVPTYNRPDLLHRCLTALLDQTVEANTYEIIIVDDGANDEVKRLVEAMGRATEANLRYIAVTQSQGPAAARNVGWRAAGGEIIAFTDDDCIPEPGWLQAGLAAFKDGIVGASGRLVVTIPANPTDYELNETGLEESEFITANCFYRWEALAGAGGFDERFTAAWREDTDLFLTLLKRYGGFSRLADLPDAVVVHPVRPAPWGISLQQQRKSMFNALLYKKHRQLYGRLVQPRPWHYYQIVGSALVALLGVITRQRWLAVSAALIWFALTGRFCWRRLARTARTPSHMAEMVLTSILLPFLSLFWRIWGAVKFRVFFA